MTMMCTRRSHDFHADRRAGLSRDRDRKLTRLDGVRREITTILAEVQTGTRPASADLMAKVKRLGALERQLVDDIARLHRKMQTA